MHVLPGCHLAFRCRHILGTIGRPATKRWTGRSRARSIGFAPDVFERLLDIVNSVRGTQYSDAVGQVTTRSGSSPPCRRKVNIQCEHPVPEPCWQAQLACELRPNTPALAQAFANLRVEPYLLLGSILQHNGQRVGLLLHLSKRPFGEQPRDAGVDTRVDAGVDAGIDAPPDSGPDAPMTTATSTATATSTLTVTGTSTTTTTSTATGTSVGPEPRPDGAPMAGTDAFTVAADTAASDVAVSHDGLQRDGVIIATDTPFAVAASDGSTSSSVPDGGPILADVSAASMIDAMGARQDGGRLSAIDSAGNQGTTTEKTGSSGCGCVIGGRTTRLASIAPLLVLGLLMLRYRRRPRR